MKNYYDILGVPKTASKDEIKKAFHKLAHKYHPDKSGGDEKQFKEVNEAYSALSDDQKRQQYDTYGSTGGFNQQSGGFGGFNWNGFEGFQQGGFGGQNGDIEFDLSDILGQFFGGGRGQRQKKGKSVQIDVELSFKESVFGAKRSVSPLGVAVEFDIPPGIDNGSTLRIAGYGHPSESKDGQPGDLLVRIWVKADARYKKEGQHLITDLHIKLTSALLGDNINLDTLDGSLKVEIPQGIYHGEMLRVRGKGIVYEHDKNKRGDLYIRVHVDMPKKLSKDAKKAVEELKKEGI